MAYEVKINISVRELESSCNSPDLSQEVCFQIGESEYLDLSYVEEQLLSCGFECFRAWLSTYGTSEMLNESSREYQQNAWAMEREEGRRYQVQGEVGRYEVQSFDVVYANGCRVPGGSRMFGELSPRALYQTKGFEELSLFYGVCDLSYRKTQSLLERIAHQPGSVKLMSLQEQVDKEFALYHQCLESKVEQILEDHHFEQQAKPLEPQSAFASDAFQLEEKGVETVLEEMEFTAEENAILLKNPVLYEDAEESVYICVDDVGVKEQTPHRQEALKEQDPKKDQPRRSVYQTVAHLCFKGESYLLNGSSLRWVLKMVVAFLLHNQRLHKRWIFLVDGQRTLYRSIEKYVAFKGHFTFILDWYHLEKKAKELLSLALKGRAMRNATLEQILPLLWHGAVDQTITSLENIDPQQVKDLSKVKEFIGYLRRNRHAIPVYEIRKRLGMKNSSNVGEKANDRLVASRQKHNGMSCSENGSVALASITAIKKNNEMQKWLDDGDIDFKLAA